LNVLAAPIGALYDGLSRQATCNERRRRGALAFTPKPAAVCFDIERQNDSPIPIKWGEDKLHTVHG
jgi:hypothetical protein